jgi:hypothetical protein
MVTEISTDDGIVMLLVESTSMGGSRSECPHAALDPTSVDVVSTAGDGSTLGAFVARIEWVCEPSSSAGPEGARTEMAFPTVSTKSVWTPTD